MYMYTCKPNQRLFTVCLCTVKIGGVFGTMAASAVHSTPLNQSSNLLLNHRLWTSWPHSLKKMPTFLLPTR